MEDIDSIIHYDELINPALVVLSNSAQETSFNLLNNVKNIMINNFWSIKWLFEEIKELKEKKNKESNQNIYSD